MKSFVYFVVIVLIVIFSYNLFLLIGQYLELKDNYDAYLEKKETLVTKEGLLRADIEYYSNKSNLIKELRAKFDYKFPGEKLFKIK